MACECTEERIGKGGRFYIVCRCPVDPAEPPKLRYGLKQSEWRRLSRKVIARDKGVCAYCRTAKPKMQCDHVIPWSRGGTNDEANLVAACSDCNRKKSNRLVPDGKADA